MKFDYEILPERGLILERLTGEATLADLFAGLRRLWADPLYSKTYNGIVDLSAASVGLALGDVRALIGFLQERAPVSSGRWAVVVISPLATAYLILCQRALASRHELEVFSTWAAACDFIGVDVPPPAP